MTHCSRSAEGGMSVAATLLLFGRPWVMVATTLLLEVGISVVADVLDEIFCVLVIYFRFASIESMR